MSRSSTIYSACVNHDRYKRATAQRDWHTVVRRKKMTFLVLLHLLWLVVEIKGQVYPYVAFGTDRLLNHSYINLGLVGNEFPGDSVVCHTDLLTCCSNTEGVHRGDWYLPSGDRLHFDHSHPPIVYESRIDQKVLLKRNGNANVLASGVYRCDIPTNDIHDANDTSVRASIYIGLYADGGDISISGGINVTREQFQPMQFTITFISTGGPATTVTWTRDSATITEGNETVLDDPVTAQYTHTLTVTGRLPGLYTCTVANNKPSQAAMSIIINIGAAAPVEKFQVEASNETSLSFSWTSEPTSPTTGFQIECAPLGEGVLTLNNPSATTAEVTGLVPGTSYNCCLTATGHLIDSLAQCVTHCTKPATVPVGALEMFEASAGERQVNFTWSAAPETQHSRCTVTGYTLTCSPSPSSLPLSTTTQSGLITLVVAGFSPSTVYHCSVVATNSVGAGPPTNTSFTTLQDYSYFQLYFVGIEEGCSRFISTNETGKLGRVADMVLKVLAPEYNNCTSESIEGNFTCDPGSPTHVTYRARLEGTSETDSGSLISLIEQWVSNETAVTVGGEVLTLDLDCPVAISSLNEEFCMAL